MKAREKVATRIVAVPTKNMRKKEIGHQERKSIEQAVNFNVFSKCVFMPNGGPGWAMIMEEVYNTMDPKPNKEEVGQASWMLPRGEYVASVFNNTRGYISGQMKKAFGKYAQGNNGEFPDLNVLEEIATRSETLYMTQDVMADQEKKAEHEKKMKLFEWYWVVLIGCAVPQNTRLWTEKVKFHKLMSGKKSNVTPQMEAFVVANVENNYDYWKARYPLARKYPNHDIRRKPKGTIRPQLRPAPLKREGGSRNSCRKEAANKKRK
jgi:hypothetical protein